MIGEHGDGMKIHPLHTIAYLDRLVRPNLEIGAARAGRTAADLTLVAPVMTAVSDDEPTRLKLREQVRQRLAFYGSTPGYEGVFEASGWPGVGERLSGRMRDGKLSDLASLITDKMVDAMAITASWGELPEKLAAKYRGRVSRIVCYSALEQWHEDPAAAERWQDAVRAFKTLTSQPA